MKSDDEKPVFKSRNVKITSLKATLYGKSYSIEEITSATMITNSSKVKNVLWAIAGVIGLLIIMMSCVYSINFDLMGYSIIGLILIGIAIYVNRTSKPTTYQVQIIYRSVQKMIFDSKDRSLAENIVDAINEAIDAKSDITTSHE